VEPPGNESLTAEQFADVLPGVDALIAGGEPVTADLMAVAPTLRVIARVGVGYDSVDLNAATARGIVVTITPGTNHDSVAEHAFALLLAVARRIAVNDALIRRGIWNRAIVRPLRGQVLGLVGLGRIGRAMVPRALAFGMEVVACDPRLDPAFDAGHGVRRLPFPELLSIADVVSLHLPLTETTRALFDRQTFERMKPGALLINTARGGLVVEADLFEALRSGHLAGAGLDVTDPEPPLPDNPLLTLPNVVMAPHIGGVDSKSLADMAERAARCVVELREGGWPEECLVNPELGPGWRW
jgi:phosphoglycerate dehydrogenase-like enzyme